MDARQPVELEKGWGFMQVCVYMQIGCQGTASSSVLQTEGWGATPVSSLTMQQSAQSSQTSRVLNCLGMEGAFPKVEQPQANGPLAVSLLQLFGQEMGRPPNFPTYQVLRSQALFAPAEGCRTAVLQRCVHMHVPAHARSMLIHKFLACARLHTRRGAMHYYTLWHCPHFGWACAFFLRLGWAWGMFLCLGCVCGIVLVLALSLFWMGMWHERPLLLPLTLPACTWFSILLGPTGPWMLADLVYVKIRGKTKDALMRLIEREREGELVDRALIKNILGIFIETSWSAPQDNDATEDGPLHGGHSIRGGSIGRPDGLMGHKYAALLQESKGAYSILEGSCWNTGMRKLCPAFPSSLHVPHSPGHSRMEADVWIQAADGNVCEQANTRVKVQACWQVHACMCARVYLVHGSECPFCSPDVNACDRGPERSLCMCVSLHVPHARTLVCLQVGMGGMECYEQDFEEFLLADTGAYYKVKAAAWIEQDSCPDYMQKADDCLQKEEER
eukprot:scaffold177355_cov20-Tisochrysis_lutea.AAC.1